MKQQIGLNFDVFLRGRSFSQEPISHNKSLKNMHNLFCFYRSKAIFAENMTNHVKKRVKVPPQVPKRKQRMVCLMSEEEVRIVDGYLKKYKITNKARWLRETVLSFIRQKMDEDYPTLFNEHDMRR